MRPRLLGLPLLASLATLTLTSGCDRAAPAATPASPEPIDTLRMFDSYGELLATILTAMRTGDLATANSIIATDGQVATMCPEYIVSKGGPYDPPSVEVATRHCQDVFGKIPDDVIAASLEDDDHGVHAEPELDGGFVDYWADRCPGMQVYTLYGVFETHGEGLPQAGLEVNGIFTYHGKWGLMNIPRCRGEGE